MVLVETANIKAISGTPPIDYITVLFTGISRKSRAVGHQNHLQVRRLLANIYESLTS